MGTIYQSAQKKNNTYHLRTSRGHAIAANEDHPAMNHFLKVLSSVDIGPQCLVLVDRGMI